MVSVPIWCLVLLAVMFVVLAASLVSAVMQWRDWRREAVLHAGYLREEKANNKAYSEAYETQRNTARTWRAAAETAQARLAAIHKALNETSFSDADQP